MRTNLYVDGFNFYYRALKGTPYKWIDLGALATAFLRPGDTLGLVRYFTATVSGAVDPMAPVRQEAYLNALRTLPNVSLHFGNFLAGKKWRPLACAPDNPAIRGQAGISVKVRNMEEKGSDVNLAVHLLHDAWRGSFDQAFVITKDTDLIEPIRLVTQELRKPVGLLCPDSSCPSGLEAVASFVKHIRHQHLKKAQFPDPVNGPHGPIAKPDSW